MRKSVLFGVLAALLAVAPNARAGVYADSLGKCLVAHMSPDDNALTITWIFSAIAAHPVIAPYAKFSQEKHDELNKAYAGLVTRLVTEDCRSQTRDAVKYEGTGALEPAFSIVGAAAVRGLMTHPDVLKEVSAYTSMIDEKKIQKVFTDEEPADTADGAQSPATDAKP